MKKCHECGTGAPEVAQSRLICRPRKPRGRYGHSAISRLRANLFAIPLTLVALLVLSACGRGSDGDRRIEETLAGMDLHARIAQLIAVPVALPSSVAADELVGEFSAYPSGRFPGTIWIDSATVEGLATMRFELGERALPVIFGARLDEGVGGVVQGATRVPILREDLGDEAYADQLGPMVEMFVGEAALLGISLGIVSAPPLLNAPDPSVVVHPSGKGERLAALFAAAGGAGLPLALRLFWSPGAEPIAHTWDLARLGALELPTLSSVLQSNAGAMMLGNAILPALSGDSTLPFLSPAVIEGLLRRDHGWNGIVIADLRVSADTAITEFSLALDALAAGADLLITAAEPPALIDSIAAAVASGRISPDRIEEAARRNIGFKVDRAPEFPAAHPDSVARALLALASRRAPTFVHDAARMAEEPLASYRAEYLREVTPADVGFSATGLEAADRAILAALDEGTFTAAALAIGRAGKLVRLRGYGQVGPDGSPVDPRSTIFDIASLTKVVGTTTAAAILVDRGDLEIDAPVQRYISEFSGEQKEEVTIRHLLAHTSGLPSGLWLYGSADSREEALRQVIAQPLLRRPGESPAYSDLGMILLAEIVERVSGSPIDYFLATNLFVPLGMSSTMFLPPTRLHSRIVPTALDTERPYPVHGVVHDGNAFRLYGVTGHAGLFSTAGDLAVFTRMMVDRGRFDPISVLSDSIIATFTSRQAGAEERALGWDTPADRSSAGRYFSARAFGHTGYTGTSIWADPDRDLFVVLLTNRTYTEAAPSAILNLRIAVHEAAARAIMDEPAVRRPGSR